MHFTRFLRPMVNYLRNVLGYRASPLVFGRFFDRADRRKSSDGGELRTGLDEDRPRAGAVGPLTARKEESLGRGIARAGPPGVQTASLNHSVDSVHTNPDLHRDRREANPDAPACGEVAETGQPGRRDGVRGGVELFLRQRCVSDFGGSPSAVLHTVALRLYILLSKGTGREARTSALEQGGAQRLDLLEAVDGRRPEDARPLSGGALRSLGRGRPRLRR